MKSRIIVPFLLGCIVSFFFFPVSFTFLPASINTKMILAVLGALFFLWDALQGNGGIKFSREVFFMAAIAVFFSIACYYSAVANDTNDMSYATYFASFFTWLGGAYGVCGFLKFRYGKVDISLIITYLMWVCVAQCISALLIDNIPAFKLLIDSIISGNEFVEDINRMYGIGASLDTAGVRFSIVLILVAHQFGTKVVPTKSVKKIIEYLFAYTFIVVVGNMISRTTTVGAGMGLIYILIYLGRINKGYIKSDQLRAIFLFVAFLIVVVPSLSYLYNTNANFHNDMRFAFEGFFNWRETGVWRTDSTDKLNNVMWIWPEDPKTWAIGSGLFGGFIYSTDIGYCRFILYCGILGFSIFASLFIYCAIAFDRKYEEGGLLSLMLLVLPFIIWIKVSTDIFLIYALLFCCIPSQETDKLTL